MRIGTRYNLADDQDRYDRLVIVYAKIVKG